MSSALQKVAKSLLILQDTFQREPDRFFTERDIHHFLWENLATGELAQITPAEDGETVLLHSEYPYERKIRYACTYHDENRSDFKPLEWNPGDSIKIWEELSHEKKRNARRPYYDIVVLGASSIRKYSIHEVSRKEFEKSAGGVVDVAIEVKFIPGGGLTTFEIRGVMEDFDKLLKASDAKHKIQLVVDKGNVKTGISKDHLDHFKKSIKACTVPNIPRVFLVAAKEQKPYDPTDLKSAEPMRGISDGKWKSGTEIKGF